MLLTTKQMSGWQKLKDKQFKICCNGIKLEGIREWKLLDITSDENLTLSSHTSEILKNSYLHSTILKKTLKIHSAVCAQTVSRIANLFKNRLL